MFKNIKLYKGPIYKLYSSDIKLTNNRLVSDVVDEKVFDDELFYNRNGLLISIRYDTVLLDRIEALNYSNYSIDKSRNRIIDSLSVNRSSLEDIEFKKYLKSISSYIYCVPSEIKYDDSISHDTLKILKSSFKKKK